MFHKSRQALTLNSCINRRSFILLNKNMNYHSSDKFHVSGFQFKKQQDDSFEMPPSPFKFPSTWDEARDLSLWIQGTKDLSMFYFNGTKDFYNRYKDAKQLSKDTKYRRSFQTTNWKEFKFIQSAYNDVKKMFPIIFILFFPGSTFFIFAMSIFYPHLLPLEFQPPAHQVWSDWILNKSRSFESKVIKSVLNTPQSPLSLSPLSDSQSQAQLSNFKYLKTDKDYIMELVNELSIIDLNFINQPENFATEFISQRKKILEVLSQKNDITLESEFNSLKPKIYRSLLEFWRPRHLTRHLAFIDMIRLNMLSKHHLDLIEDDALIRKYGIDLLSKTDIIDALHERGLNLRGYEDNFTIEQLKILLESWLIFSNEVRQDLRYLLAGPLISFENPKKSLTAIKYFHKTQ